MPGLILTLAPAVVTVDDERAEPCTAIDRPGHTCGARPCARYVRFCGVAGHMREVWLCPIHASMTAYGGAICRECAALGYGRPVRLLRITETMRI